MVNQSSELTKEIPIPANEIVQEVLILNLDRVSQLIRLEFHYYLPAIYIMSSGIKLVSAPNIIAVLIACVFMTIAFMNPGFDDPLWPAAVLGVLTALVSFITGILLLILKFFKIGKISNTASFAMGLLILSFGIIWIPFMLVYTFFPKGLFYIIPMIIVGLFICMDAYYSEK